jgi:HSP20 family molecular chaperone IbpA
VETTPTVRPLPHGRVASLFRSVTLPAPIDPAAVTARYRNGLLTITATIAVEQPVRTIDVRAA